MFRECISFFQRIQGFFLLSPAVFRAQLLDAPIMQIMHIMQIMQIVQIVQIVQIMQIAQNTSFLPIHNILARGFLR